MESPVKVMNASAVKIMFEFFVELNAKKLSIVRNTPKVIAAI